MILTANDEVTIHAEVMTIMHLAEWLAAYPIAEIMQDANLGLAIKEADRLFKHYAREWSLQTGISLDEVGKIYIYPDRLVKYAVKLAHPEAFNSTKKEEQE